MVGARPRRVKAGRQSRTRVLYWLMPRPSQHASNVAYYARNRGREFERIRSRQAENLAFLRGLRSGPCLDCRLVFAPHQMDFDHRDPAIKSFRLSEGRAMLRSRATLLAEVAKCDVVCANCHRIRTRNAHAGRLMAAEPPSSPSRGLDVRRARWRAQAGLLDDLRAAPCADCGGSFPPCAMDFDHRPDEHKLFGVTRMIGRSGTPRILAEVAKCDIVCANCHRARTFDRRLGAAQRAGVAQLVERQPSKL